MCDLELGTGNLDTAFGFFGGGGKALEEHFMSIYGTGRHFMNVFDVWMTESFIA